MRESHPIPREGRILAIDYGGNRVGLAVSDPLQITAQAFDTIQSQGKIEIVVARIVQICREKEVVGIVLGHPINMNGTEGSMAEITRRLATTLEEAVQIPVHLWDERLSSWQAERVLREMGKKPSRHKKEIDKLAATFILRSYLDSRSR